MADKLIKLFIMESKKNLKTVDLSNWVGKVFIGNRKHIDIIQTISELSKNVKHLTGFNIDFEGGIWHVKGSHMEKAGLNITPKECKQLSKWSENIYNIAGYD